MEKLYKELYVRETAAGHLSGIPAQQNETRINEIYDELVALRIQELEAKGMGVAEATVAAEEEKQMGQL